MKNKIKLILIFMISITGFLNAQTTWWHTSGQLRTGIPSGGFNGASANTGSLLFYNSTNTNTVTFQSGTTTTSYTMTLPTAQGGASTVLTNNGSGTLSWQSAAGIEAWSLKGNAGTTAGTNFLGTTDAVDLVIKTNNTERARVLSTGNVGIGTSSPTQILNVKGAALSCEETSTDAGMNVYFKRQDGTERRMIGASSTGTSGEFDLVIGQSSSLWKDVRFLLNGGDKAIIKASGNVGIGTTSPGRLLEVNGQMKTTNDNPEKPNAGSWTGYSDQRLKQNIEPFADGLAVLRQVKPKTYQFKGIGNLPTNETFIGVIAQELQPVAPYCVKAGKGKLTVKQSEAQNFSGAEIIETLAPDSTGEVYSVISPLTYNYDGLIYVMINSIKQLDSANTELLKKDSIKDAELQAMQTINALYDTKFKQMEDKIAKLDSVINSCCSLGSTKSMNLNPDYSLTNSKDVELSNKNVVILDQNVPNPFAEQTTINYYLPDYVMKAQIIFLEQSGKLIKTVDLTEKGKGTLNVFANDLTSGVYSYSLIVDGQTIETKKMVKTK